MHTLIARGRGWMLLLIGVVSAVFIAAAYQGATGISEQASMDVHGDAYHLQQKVEETFPRDVHAVPFVVYTESGENVLTKETLISLRDRLTSLRDSSFGDTSLRTFVHPAFGDKAPEYAGAYTIADAVEDRLAQRGSSLAEAEAEEVRAAATAVLDAPRIGAFFREQLSTKAERVEGAWQSPAYRFVVQADNEALGGGVFRRTVGADATLIRKEEFNRELEKKLQLSNDNVHMRGVAIDLNLEADEEGFSPPVAARTGGLLLGLAVLVGLIFRSLRVTVVAAGGLVVLLGWIFGFPALTDAWARPSVMTELILPLAFLALGIDFFLYAVTRYYRERWSDAAPRRAFPVAFAAVATGLVLAMVSDSIAFAANYVADVEAIRSFALTGAFSALAAFLIMGFAAPAVLALWDEKRPRGAGRIPAINFAPVLGMARRFPGSAIVFVGVATVASALFIPDITKQLDPEDFIAPSSSFVTSLDVQEEHWGAVHGEEAEIYIEGDLDAPRAEEAIDEAMADLRDSEHLARTQEGDRLLMPYGPPEEDTRTDGTDAFHLTVEVLDTRELANVRTIREDLREDLSPVATLSRDTDLITDWGVTGPPFTRLESLDAVTNALMETIGTAALAILIVLAIAYRSIWYAVVTMIPMFFVLTWTYGFMGYAGYPLNSITATIAAVALGVGIDYAVHIVQAYREHRAEGYAPHAAIDAVGQTKGFAALVAAVSSITGFGILATAPMPLFATYGILGVAMIGFSFLAAILVLPPLLLLDARFARRSR